MQRLNRDAVVAIVLLLVSGVFFWASFDIRQPDYGVLMPSTWPRLIIGLLAFLSVIYLIQSLKQGAPAEPPAAAARGGLRGWIAHWRNPMWCFFLFFCYLASLPILGMLIGGVLFVFVLMGVLGGWSPRNLLLHGTVALLSVGGMWSLFTYGLGVILPQGVIFNPFGF